MASDEQSSKIIEKIEEKTQATIDKIKEEMEEAIAQINKETEQKIKQIRDQIISQAKKQAEVEFLQAKTRNELELTLKLTKYRDQLVDNFIDTAKKEIVKLTQSKDPKYTESLEKMILSAAITLKEPELRIFYREEDKSLFSKDFIAKISDTLQKEYNLKVKFHLADEHIKCIGGVIVETLDGSIRIDNTYEKRIDRYYDDLKHELSKLLTME